MSVPEGKVPVLKAVSAAWAFARIAAPRFAVAAAVLGLAAGALDLFMRQSGAGGDVGATFFAWALAGAVSSILYAGYLRFAHQDRFGRFGGVDVGREEAAVFTAMAVIAFFLFIIFVVALIPGMIVLFTAWAPYFPAFEAAGQDQVAMAQAMGQAFEGAPWPPLALVLIYAFVWMALTSRLYLAAPASAATGRVRTFETWVWTKGNMLRIMAARLTALAPAMIVLAFLPSFLLSLAAGGSPEAAAALVSTQPAVALAALALTHILTYLTVWAAEAGLSNYLYRGLKPPNEP